MIVGGLVEDSGWSGIGAAHFGAGLLGREHPFQVCAGEIALALPGGDLALEFLAVVVAGRCGRMRGARRARRRRSSTARPQRVPSKGGFAPRIDRKSTRLN